MTAQLSIGEVARQSGIKVPTIRYYEQIGLLPAPTRSESNRRCYRQADIRRLGFIRHARELGFEIGAIRTILGLQDQPDRPCDGIDDLARAHLVAIDTKISQLVALRQEIQRMLDCCAGGRVAECRIIEAIATA
jgi:DNA-binding transcriptional MerR regulator